CSDELVLLHVEGTRFEKLRVITIPDVNGRALQWGADGRLNVLYGGEQVIRVGPAKEEGRDDP
ncbi:MAG TPA: hypothetical protein VFH51_03690, partial [Myxococcota bacterium]|nr:hypothetical protein [Myxococcota bacterium]